MQLTTDHYDLVLAEDGSQENVEAWADALTEVGNDDTKERIKMARNQKPEHIAKTLRFAVQGIFKTLAREADWNKSHGYAIGN